MHVTLIKQDRVINKFILTIKEQLGCYVLTAKYLKYI
jgi:hypothetical protein